MNKQSNEFTSVVDRFTDQKLYANLFLSKTERSELAAIAADIL